MNKIIFLDIDGVVSSARANGYSNLDLYVVNFLIWVCEKAEAKIVISSTWRHNHNRKFWESVFKSEHIHEDYKTPCLRNTGDFNWLKTPIRGDEVNAWLEDHPEVDDYLILDDDSDFTKEQRHRLILTDSHNGLMFDEMMRIRDHFKIKTFPKEHKHLYQHPNMYEASREKESI